MALVASSYFLRKFLLLIVYLSLSTMFESQIVIGDKSYRDKGL